MTMTARAILEAICPTLAASDKRETFLEMARSQTSPTHFGANREKAIALRAAHEWVLSQRSQGAGGAIQSITEGRLSMAFANSGGAGDLSQTSYGMQLKALIRASAPVIRVIGAK